METNFSAAQLADPTTAHCETALRNCVHCGFCTATCPTYLLSGDERESPRGRIYMIKDMLEHDRTPSEEVVQHIDQCLSCLACTTTCPSGVDYMHLIDHARHYVEKRYRRPLHQRLMRTGLAFLLPRPNLLRLALVAGRLVRPMAPLLPQTFRSMLNLLPANGPRTVASEGGSSEGVHYAMGTRTRRVALLTGCAQTVLAPTINDATVRFLRRHGCEVVIPTTTGCCGALTHHMGKGGEEFARPMIDYWTQAIDEGGLDAIIINTSGCGTTVKDYGFMFRSDPDYTEKAAKVSALAMDITEFAATLDLEFDSLPDAPKVVYHPACSLQHGQKVTREPSALLRSAGFAVSVPKEAHLCCGSAGTYNLLHPQTADALRERKLGHIAAENPDVIATGNLGCITQLAAGTDIPVVHTIELLDWATGGPRPSLLHN